ncbi:MAG TPA: thioredoxin [Bacteroidales bacterium]|jgi:thioredoxin 1|nr:thioredoxin [Bacteroidales bacterium]OQC46399.1 MAG: Thioredoxin-1 [Bacteroidetes bacterium ADurb.Bin035]HOF07551.1 thioredoxin [Bacteroidales bacterium]HOJ25546.1 thioredoxin [Bacteroidales bacterium]HON97843.1 thioredoxin [Bacteroidales bacterium]
MKENLSDSNFDEIINNSSVPVIVDFWAEWCGPCKMIGQVLDELNNDYDDKILIGKVNVDEQGSLAMKYGIRNIPTLLFFKNGQLIDKQVGSVPRKVLEEKLKSIL